MLGTVLFYLQTPPALAERFLTIAEAQNICFPQATDFEARVLRFTAQEAAAVEKRGGVPVRNRGNRFWVAKDNGTILGVLLLDYVVGKHELIDYVVAISPEGEVRQVEVLEYRESYGGEIRGTKWREQFKGKTAKSPLRLSDDIYNISGATLSCRHVTQGIKRLLATFEVVLRPRVFAAADRLPKPGTGPERERFR